MLLFVLFTINSSCATALVLTLFFLTLYSLKLHSLVCRLLMLNIELSLESVLETDDERSAAMLRAVKELSALELLFLRASRTCRLAFSVYMADGGGVMSGVDTSTTAILLLTILSLVFAWRR